MKVYIIIGLTVLVASCQNPKKVLNTPRDPGTVSLHEGQWTFNFKNEVFVRCLKKLYPPEFSRMFETVDGSTAANTEQLGFDQQVLSLTDSLATAFTKRNEATWTIENRKVTLNICIAYRNSPELDSIALKFYKLKNIQPAK